MNPFDIVFNRHLVFGAGKLREVPGMLSWHKVKKVFLTSFDRGNPNFIAFTSLLDEAGIPYVVYADIQGEPDARCINQGRDLYLEEGCDCAVAFGGGSIIDATKAINMLAVNGGMIEQYQMEGREVLTAPPLFIAIPTTSGTGAEATKTAVVLNNDNGLKKSLYHTTMIADIVVLDPELTLSLPAPITAATGMDALSHAIESYVSLNATPITEMYGLAAVRLISQNLERAVREPSDVEARGAMMLASYFGGVAITAGIGIAHIMAQPLGGTFKIPHGDACSIFLPASIELNRAYAKERYARLAEAFGVDTQGLDADAATDALIGKIRELQAAISAPTHLTPYLNHEIPLDELIDIVKRTTGHITCNPRPLNEELMREAYELAL
ncbi:iron-containing alcohol dehydrogenase [[Collinsella] massiliensis]|uniref:Alcohol dehydrogenase n=1 Tax=[Collinsella] massiliensis TaxID=1232426 RepID=A0A1Y3Y3D9_9ACTN|nr:iron-containing alcohol dehydrogenase [[Collinsella] massiliensis]OUN89889.1 alcohol dehydrogenase [[Collinsella] massiliensis]